ncbi:hypothetical protein CJF42_15520 [Pseudoalteromonas sp. NBT06-2]|nr:hypothetical protein CJF42_15520 [Pseudoalteromonas sp. NBT06-2]
MIKNVILVINLFFFSGFNIKAEDIELYVNNDIEGTEKHRVLIIFDTSGSMAWSVADGNSCGTYSSGPYYGDYIPCSDSRIGVAKSAISGLVTSNPDIEFGLMRFRSSQGGYVLSGLGTSQAELLIDIVNLRASGSTPLSETLWESYRYLSGKSMTYGGIMSDRDKNIDDGTTYTSAFVPEVVDGKTVLRCDNSINIILMSDGDPTNDIGRNTNIKNLFSAGEVPYRIKTYQGYDNYLHAMAKYMYTTDLYSATSHDIDIGRTFTIGFGTGMSSAGKALLEETADLGGGVNLHANTASELVDALEKTINKIREVNGTFSAPSVASNNFDRTQSRDSVYYAMFYPDKGARWKGNLKKLKVEGKEIVDSRSTPQPAIADNGDIKKTARTYWLPSTAGDDGNDVQQGGANLALSGISSRNVYTDVGTGSPLPLFTKDNAQSFAGSAADLASYMGINETELANLFSWTVGNDVDDEDSDGSTTDKRIDIMGDPLHSKPITLDYGDGSVRVLVGTNAGFIHMFKDSGDTITESWAFIPYELYPNLDDLRQNKVNTKVYGMDAPAAVYFYDVNDNGIVETGDKVWAFFGMRRGGYSYYALDITAPDSPKLLWTLKNTESGFEKMGQTWSKPYIGFVNVDGYTNKPLLIFGAGYDINKDNDGKSADSVGAGIYIIDAESKALVWSLISGGSTHFPGTNSIPSDIAAIDSDYDGYIDRLYAGDTGGDLWRVDLPGTDPLSTDTPWTVFKIAELGSTTVSENRKFFYKPEVARTYFSKVSETTIEENGETEKYLVRKETPYEAILIGSGNRVHPSYKVINDYLFMIRDENTITKSFIDEKVPTSIKIGELLSINSDPFGNTLSDEDTFRDVELSYSAFKGWKYSLNTGEKSLSKASVVGGVAYYSTFTAADDSSDNQCSLSGGSGSLYAFHLHYGTKIYNSLKFDMGDNVPDTPQLFFDKNDADESQFLLIGVGKGEDGTGVVKAKSILENLVPTDVDNDGTIDLIQANTLGLQTIRSYIYRQEQSSGN